MRENKKEILNVFDLQWSKSAFFTTIYVMNSLKFPFKKIILANNSYR